MIKSFGFALLAGVLCASTASAVHDPDVNGLELRCQTGLGKASVKFVACKAKCVSKCIVGARRVPALNPESDCFPPFGGATLGCIADPLKGCEARAVAANKKVCFGSDPLKTNCPECYAARSGGDQTCGAYSVDVVVNGLSNPTAPSLEAQVDSFGFVFCNDNPNNPAEDKCEQGVAKSLVKFVGCKFKCYDRCVGAAHRGIIPPGSCNPPSPSDPTTSACLFNVASGCEAKAIGACNKACMTPPADAPECYGGLCSSLVSLVETAVDGNLANTFCGSPSGAFLTE